MTLSETPSERFQSLLRELFQFNCADLDFGIYRIMNHKRDVIERFIQKDLIKGITDALGAEAAAADDQARTALEEAAQRVRDTLGDDAIGAGGQLAETYRSTPVGKRYLELRDRTAPAPDQTALETLIFNHLYSFFSRYYDSGDFLSKRRYSRKEKYAIPYNGEEVYLHWANSDQYYVKTGEYFTDYRFTSSNGVTVHFKLQTADVEKDNVKGDKRFFLPLIQQAAFDKAAKEVILPFEFRPLTQGEQTTYGSRNQQDAILGRAVAGIPRQFSKDTDALAALFAVHHRTDDDNSVTFLEHHLRQYTRRNTSDFFIHKDLKGFLTRELDFYLKNEVLNLDDLDAGGEARADGWFQTMRVIRAVGLHIIEFLAQIEDFQKKLFEKKKFVTETQYCITVQNIPEGFYSEIAANDAQWQEWKDLFSIKEEQKDLFTPQDKTARRVAFLKTHPTLVLDTRHFAGGFVDRLLASFDDLDDATDGLLIHSENFQALKLLQEKYRERVKCVYIDPPFNTGQDEFLYKDGYQHSSWLAMMEARALLARDLLSADGTFYAHIDYSEKERLKLLLDRYFHYITEIIWRIGWVSGYKSAAKKFVRNHDTIYQYGKAGAPFFVKSYIPYPDGYKRRDGSPPTGQGYPLEDTWNCSDLDELNSIQIMSFSREKVGDQALTQKNENLVARMIRSSSADRDLVLDFFVGSGTTSSVAHKLGRRYIAIEMGEQFLVYVLPRMKRVLFGDPYGISSEVKWKGGGIFKYIRLESYEDALNNIEFNDESGQRALAFDDYVLRYLLDWETKDCATFLNVEQLASPFSYALTLTEGQETKTKAVDVPETFNFLLGLHVTRRQTLHDGDRRYLVIQGRLDHKQVVVIWRDTAGWGRDDYERDRAFAADHKLTEGADDVFVNGESLIAGARALEPLFKSRMFGGM